MADGPTVYKKRSLVLVTADSLFDLGHGWHCCTCGFLAPRNILTGDVLFWVHRRDKIIFSHPDVLSKVLEEIDDPEFFGDFDDEGP